MKKVLAVALISLIILTAGCLGDTRMKTSPDTSEVFTSEKPLTSLTTTQEKTKGSQRKT
jgi:uncharacterized protein YcfL